MMAILLSNQVLMVSLICSLKTYRRISWSRWKGNRKELRLNGSSKQKEYNKTFVQI